MVSGLKSGKQFESEISRSLRFFQELHPVTFFWHKLADTFSYVRINPKIIMPKQPCDYICVCRGIFYALEAKSTRGQHFRFDWLKPHQKKSLRKVERAGGIGLLLFSFRKKRPVNCIVLGIHKYLELEKQFREKRKSIPRKAIEETGMELKRGRNSSWNMMRLFK